MASRRRNGAVNGNGNGHTNRRVGSTTQTPRASAVEMAASLAETAGQAEAVAASTEQLVSGVNEMAASIEQVAANTVSLAASVAGEELFGFAFGLS